jgi:urease accessory protein
MISHVQIQTATRQDITRLKQAYSTPPFKVANITEDKKAHLLHLVLMSSSPGILDGDEYNLSIDIGEHGHLQLHTQSYQRLFQMKKGAQQHMQVNIQKDASLTYISHPTVPHKNSIFTSRNTIHLQSNSRLLWGEILTCGRTQNGEQFHFSKYHNITEVLVNNRLFIKENLLVQPAIMNVQALGQWEGYTHQASLIYVNNTSNCELIHANLSQEKDIIFGISTIASTGLIVRILGYKAEQLYNCLKTIATLLNQAATAAEKPELHVV